MKFFYLLLSIFLLYTLQWNTFVEAITPIKLRTRNTLNIMDSHNNTVPIKNCRYYYWTEDKIVLCDIEGFLNYFYVQIPVKESIKSCKISNNSNLTVEKLYIGGRGASDIAYIPNISNIKTTIVIKPRSGRGELYVRDHSLIGGSVMLSYNRVFIRAQDDD